jgi:uncharacterized membrane protein
LLVVVRRIASIDIIRGAVMVLMAIDHVRVYSGQPAGGPTAGIFFTRWVTHFCAPWFVFLAGTSAFLRGRRIAGDRTSLDVAPGSLSRDLVTRGLMLVLLELTVVRFSWTFNLDYAGFTLAGVIWMIGWCMVIMAGLVRLRTRTIGIIGVAVMALQQVFGLLPRVLPGGTRQAVAVVWNFIYPSGAPGWDAIKILYVIVPWIGVMAAGYAFGSVVIREPSSRRHWCLRAGLAATGLYLVFAVVMLLIAPADERPKLFMVLDPPKYPASQPFLLMTLGPILAALPFIEDRRSSTSLPSTSLRAGDRAAAVLSTFGRVPLFYYLLHIPLIHLVALAVNFLREGAVHQEWYAAAPFAEVPEAHMWSLPLLYLVFGVVVAILYVACRWFDRRRA